MGDGWKKGVGPYSSGVKLTTPKPPPTMSSSGKGVGPYASAAEKLSHPSELETSGVTRAKTGSMPDGSREIDVDRASRNDGYSAKVPKR
jgi:hypothetical protein